MTAKEELGARLTGNGQAVELPQLALGQLLAALRLALAILLVVAKRRRQVPVHRRCVVPSNLGATQVLCVSRAFGGREKALTAEP
jgi:hypothetical protein